MSYSVVLPEGYGYVIAAGAFCGIALTITGALAGQQRKRLGVEYPNLYASDLTAKQDKKAYEFNCAQRGAMNPHESYATALFGLAFGGLSYPLVAAGAGKKDVRRLSGFA
jgi:glutathione S-transferase